MFRDVVTRGQRRESWPAQRAEIAGRIAASMGSAAQTVSTATRVDVLSTHSEQGLRCETIRFEVLPGYRCSGLIFSDPGDDRPRPGAVCIHGTNHDLAKRAVADPLAKPDSAYAIELARRGYVTITVDQFGFGDWLDGSEGLADLYARFFAEHPQWSLDGIRLHIQRCAVSVLSAHPLVDGERIACIGNSLGGRSALHLAAFDERIRAAIVSTGVSPNLTNVYRNTATDPTQALSPRLNTDMVADGRPPWDYEEMLALVAPRGLVLIEPVNDPYNPSIDATVACFLSARHVYALLDAPQRLELLCHGLGHGTPAVLRDHAYAVIDGMLDHHAVVLR